MTRAWLALSLVACGGDKVPDAPEDQLAAFLRDTPVAELRMDETTFVKTVAPPFRGLYADYVHELEARSKALAERIAADKDRPRKHFARDANNTLEQERVRWALPTMFPSYSAAGTVFVRSGDRFVTLAGLDEAVMARVAKGDAACAKLLDGSLASKPCADVGYEVVTAGIRGEATDLARACGLARRVCGNPSP